MHHNFIKEDKTPVLQITAHAYMDEYIYIYLYFFHERKILLEYFY